MSKQAANSPKQQSSSGGSEGLSLTPVSTPSTSQKGSTVPLAQLKELRDANMDQHDDQNQDTQNRDHEERPTPEPDAEAGDEASKPALKKKGRCRHSEHSKKLGRSKKSRSKKAKVEESSSDSSSDEESSDSEPSEESSADEAPKKKSKKKVVPAKPKTSKTTKKDKRKSKKRIEESDLDSVSVGEESGSDGESEGSADDAGGAVTIKSLQQQLARLEAQHKTKRQAPKRKSSKRKSSKAKFSTDYKRVDQLWDTTIHNFKLKESAEDDDSEFAEYAFLVRRTFDWENKYKETFVDIKSKQLRAALSEVMKDCKSVSLEAEEPVIDPNILFLYLEELRTYCKALKSKIKQAKKGRKNLEQQRSLLKSLINYIDDDYADTKKTLYPLLKAGNITFDLLWALFHPGEIAVTSCYGSWDEPRCFKVEYANKCASMTRGEWYCMGE